MFTIETKYFLAYDDGNLIVRLLSNGDLKKYDSTSKQWVFDSEIGKIFTGQMPVEILSKEEASKLTGGNL